MLHVSPADHHELAKLELLGIGISSGNRGLKNILRSQTPFIILMETCLNQQHFLGLKSQLGFRQRFLVDRAVLVEVLYYYGEMIWRFLCKAILQDI